MDRSGGLRLKHREIAEAEIPGAAAQLERRAQLELRRRQHEARQREIVTTL